jgi:putative membrane protein
MRAEHACFPVVSTILSFEVPTPVREIASYPSEIQIRRNDIMLNSVIRRASIHIVLAAFSVGMVTAAAQSSSDKMASGNSGTSGAKLASADRQFIKKAAQGGLAEVQLGQLATEKAESSDVKQFGQKMVDDHGKANDKLKQIASNKGITVPDKLSAKDAATKARLGKLSGKAFDRAYMRDMVMDHTKDVSEFRTESKTATDPDVKSFASETLPTLQDHLKQAKSIGPKTGAKTSQASGGNQ